MARWTRELGQANLKARLRLPAYSTVLGARAADSESALPLTRTPADSDSPARPRRYPACHGGMSYLALSASASESLAALRGPQAQFLADRACRPGPACHWHWGGTPGQRPPSHCAAVTVTGAGPVTECQWPGAAHCQAAGRTCSMVLYPHRRGPACEWGRLRSVPPARHSLYAATRDNISLVYYGILLCYC